MRLVVAILNWNGVKHLQTYLPSVVEHSNIEGVEVFVIDNGSTDESCTWIESNYPKVKIVKLPRNYGFAGGYNRGLKNIEADRFVLLNSDVEVREGWIESVCSTMDKLRLSACSPRILDHSSPTEFEYAGASGGYIDRDGYMFCAGRIFDSFESAKDNYTDDREVFWASGAALFIDVKSWNEVGGLDSDFFAHMEEVDLCWRLKNIGLKVGVCGSADVFHLGGGTLSQSSSQKVFLNFRNNLLLLLKNENGFWPAFILRRLILDGIAAARFLFRGEFAFFFAVTKAHLVFYAMIFSSLKKRFKESKAKQTSTPNLTGRYTKSIIIDYFFNGKSKFSSLDDSKFI
jgi:hypothetical protein